MTSRSASTRSAILTSSVAGTPAVTTTSMSHHWCASGGTASRMWRCTSSADGCGSVITHANTRCACVSHASDSACFMTPIDAGATSTAQAIRSNSPAFSDFTRTAGRHDQHRTVRTRHHDGCNRSDRAIGSFRSCGAHDDQRGRLGSRERENRTARIALVDRCANEAIVRIDRVQCLTQRVDHLVAFVKGEALLGKDSASRDDVKHPEFCSSNSGDGVCPFQRIHRDRRQVHRTQHVTDVEYVHGQPFGSNPVSSDRVIAAARSGFLLATYLLSKSFGSLRWTG